MRTSPFVLPNMILGIYLPSFVNSAPRSLFSSPFTATMMNCLDSLTISSPSLRNDFFNSLHAPHLHRIDDTLTCQSSGICLYQGSSCKQDSRMYNVSYILRISI